MYFRRSFNCPIVAITSTNGTRLQIWIIHIYLRPHENICIDRMLMKGIPIKFVYRYYGSTNMQSWLLRRRYHTSIKHWSSVANVKQTVWSPPGSSHRIYVCMQLSFLSNIGAEEDWEQCIFRRSNMYNVVSWKIEQFRLVVVRPSHHVDSDKTFRSS